MSITGEKINTEITIEGLKKIGFESFGNYEYAIPLSTDDENDTIHLWSFDNYKCFETADCKVYFSTIAKIYTDEDLDFENELLTKLY